MDDVNPQERTPLLSSLVTESGCRDSVATRLPKRLREVSRVKIGTLQPMLFQRRRDDAIGVNDGWEAVT